MENIIEKNPTKQSQNKLRTIDMAYIALFSVIIAICSWIAIPTTVPFTLQTFGIFISVILLGGKRGSLSIALYILLGAIGIPVFAGFTGGVGILFGTTGGYIVGFLLSGLCYWLVTKLFGEKLYIQIIGAALGLILCYAFGTAWFMVVYAQKVQAISLIGALGFCVFPFIIPDAIKIALAFVLGKILKRHVKL